MSEHATAATFCRAAYADLMHTASNVLAMLRHMEAELHSDSKKTIVSLKHLCAQLELAKDECGIYLHPPPLSWCDSFCGADAKLRHLEIEGGHAVRDVHNQIKTYSIGFLLEHGYKASMLNEFQDLPLPDGSMPLDPKHVARDREQAQRRLARNSREYPERLDDNSCGTKITHLASAPPIPEEKQEERTISESLRSMGGSGATANCSMGIIA